MNKGIVFNIQRFCTHDGPGVRTVVFLKGCPLKCKWCANPESQSLTPELLYTKKLCQACGNCIFECAINALSINNSGLVIDYNACNNCGQCAAVCSTNALEIAGKEYTVEEIIEIIQKDQTYYYISGGGVTISGGEPLTQYNFVEKLLLRLKSLGISTAIETSGLGEWGKLERISKYTDLFLYDIKHLNEFCHKEGTGASNRQILDNLQKLVLKGCNIIIRYPLIPNYNMDEKYALELRNFLEKLQLKIVHLLPYHRLGTSKYQKLGRQYELINLKPPSEEEVKKIINVLTKDSKLEVSVER